MAIALSVLTLLSAIIPIIRQVMANAKEHHATQTRMAQVDDTVLRTSMDRVDQLFPDPPKT